MVKDEVIMKWIEEGRGKLLERFNIDVDEFVKEYHAKEIQAYQEKIREENTQQNTPKPRPKTIKMRTTISLDKDIRRRAKIYFGATGLSSAINHWLRDKLRDFHPDEY